MSSFKAYVYIALLVVLSAGLFYIQHQLDKVPVLTAENNVLKTENKEIRHEAQALLDRPRNRNDRINKLCSWAEHTARKTEGKPVKQLPVFCSACPMRGEDLAGR